MAFLPSPGEECGGRRKSVFDFSHGGAKTLRDHWAACARLRCKVIDEFGHGCAGLIRVARGEP
jgi:hypothetical protein